ncbi:MAG: hypothetical protein NZ570_02740 [Candidatus Caldarchaeum sp.]|nr:hypothetical protein [Candidatus Caldarchaeum sp.]MCS7137644.1 hypothetical protein [Candidatus Caldarchaeum sp.]MDW7978753.1 hypothetical protein [Candidatus Caldarchaeum sp.]MDW8359138.1 hypothetical protein [Candidatus Caldarchaeum sp.]
MRLRLLDVSVGLSLALALLMLTLLPYSMAAVSQPQAFYFKPMALPTTVCPPDTAQRFDQDEDGPAGFLDAEGFARHRSINITVPPVFTGRQAWLILRVLAIGTDEVHQLFLFNTKLDNSSTAANYVFLGLITATGEQVFQIPQDFLSPGGNTLRIYLDEAGEAGFPNLDPDVTTADTGSVDIDSIRVCFGGYFTYVVPFTCGFTPVDLKATEPPTTNPLRAVPAIKQGDYATNVIIRNNDRSLPTMTFNYSVYVEFAAQATPLGGITSFDFRNSTFDLGFGRLGPRASNFTSCDALDSFIRARLGITTANNKVFWKGSLIIRQPIGNGTTFSKLPLHVEAIHTYEVTVNKIKFQILNDPSKTIHRHLIGTDLEMVIAINPLNKTLNNDNTFNNIQVMRLVRENIREQFPAAADRAVIRIIEVSMGVGSSQTTTRIQPSEAPLESP